MDLIVAQNVDHPANGSEALFAQVRDTFLESLSNQERARFTNCSSPEDLVASVRNFSLPFEKGKRNKIIQFVKSFTERLAPYFEVLGTIVQSHPDWAAIAWGAFRLILQVGSQKVTLTN